MSTSLLLDHSGQPFSIPEVAPSTASSVTYSAEQREEIIAKLTAPFRLEEVNWRVISTTKDKKKGLIAPFLRTGYILDRLNSALGFGRWNKRLGEIRLDVTTKDGTVRSKIAMTCQLEIPGVGLNASTGECWAEEDNAVTSCEAQAFKRAAQNLGIGAYLFRIPKFWADIDQHKSIVDSPAFREAAARALDPFLPDEQRKKKSGNTSPQQKQTPVQNAPPQNQTQQRPAEQTQASGSGKPGASQQPAQTQQTQNRAPSQPPAPVSADKFLEQMKAKKAAAIEALGQALYDDVAENAKKALNPAMSSTNKNYAIAQVLDVAMDLLKETRLLAAELPPGAVDNVMDTFHVTTFSVIPNFAVLERVSLSLKTIAAGIVAA